MKYPYRTEIERIQAAQKQAEEYVSTHYAAEEIEKWGWANLVSDLQMDFLEGMLPSQELAEQLKNQALSAEKPTDE